MYYLSGKQMTEWKEAMIELETISYILKILKMITFQTYFGMEVTYNEVYDFWKFNLVRFPFENIIYDCFKF